MSQRAQAQTVVLETTAESLLDQVVSNTKIPVPEPIPKGYKLLPEGTKRQIHVNQDYLRFNSNKPVAITAEGKTTMYSNVRLLGTCEMVVAQRTEGSGCGTTHKRTARMETTGPVLVKE